MQRVTKEDAKKAFEVLHQYVEDKNLAGYVYEQLLLTRPLDQFISDKQSMDELASDIIELMAIQSLAKHFDAPIYMGVEPVVKRFKKVVLEYLLQ